MPSYSGYGKFSGLWRLLFAWLCFCSFFFYCLKLPCMKIYKHASANKVPFCFIRDWVPSVSFFSLRLQSPGPDLRRLWQVAFQTGRWTPFGKWMEWLLGPMEVGMQGYGTNGWKAPTTFLLYHHLFKVQGLSVSCQWIEACLQTVAEYNPWFPDAYSFGLG